MNQDQDIKDSSVLVIDDDRLSRVFLVQILEEAGFKNINQAVDGLDGWNQTIDIIPDIVFLDVNMPVMDGLEYCNKVQDNPDLNNMIIIVQTGLNSTEHKKSIFASGANDYVSKPIDSDELIARSLIHLRAQFYLKKMEEFSQRLSTEVQSAKRLIDIALPNEVLTNDVKEKTGIDIFSYFQSSSELGGDFFGVGAIDDNQVFVYLVDFSGHGVNAALNATRLDCLIKSSPDRAKDPANLMQWLNNNLYALLPPEQYATMFYGVLDTKKDTLTYVGAASPEILILHDFKEIETIECTGYPLGALKEATYENITIPFKKNNALFLYSDALIETPDKENNVLQNLPKRVQESFAEKEGVDLREAFDFFVYNFMNEYGDNVSDDLTLMMCSRMQ